MKYYQSNLGYTPVKMHTSVLSLISVEAFRRGLSIAIHAASTKRGYFVRISNGSRSCDFTSTTNPFTEKSAEVVCLNKQMTKAVLSEVGVSTPKGVLIERSSSIEEVLGKAVDLRYPIVLKPVDGIRGGNVFTDIRDQSGLIAHLDDAIKAMPDSEWLVEEQIEGVEYRVIVVGGEVASVIQRIRASVLGDGKSSIRKLIRVYNKERRRNPHLRKKLVNVDERLAAVLANQGFALDDVPPRGERIRLTGPANFSVGGGSRDCTDSVESPVRDASVAAFRAVPGLFYAGLDVIVTPAGEPYVIEINHNPAIASHHFPAEGEARDIASMIIDEHFPGSDHSGRHKVIFDLKESRLPVKKGKARKVVLPRVSPQTKAVKILLDGVVTGVGMRAWLARHARKLNIHGTVRNIGEGEVEVIAAAEPDVLCHYERLCRVGPEKAQVEGVDIQDWDFPVYLGFEIAR